jgi:hypothetical protein
LALDHFGESLMNVSAGKAKQSILLAVAVKFGLLRQARQAMTAFTIAPAGRWSRTGTWDAA